MANSETHGGRALERRLRQNRLEPRERRALRKLDAAIVAAPLDAVRDLYRARIARKELLCQRGELAALTDPEFAGTKWLGLLWNSLRRDVELLAHLESRTQREEQRTTCSRCQRAYSAAEYVHHRCEPEAAA
jgi:hypothetical protein